jgi:putative zinc finger/helix-turn-helix YgiT family protein
MMREVVMGKKSTENSRSVSGKGVFVCPGCGGKNVETSQEEYRFTYGTGEDGVELSVEIPVRMCAACGFSFHDCVAEDICHAAVCQHLGVMTPGQIRDLRTLHGLTQAEFAEVTKLGEATVSRWERGVVVQNQAYDNYLYLLGLGDNFSALRDRGRPGQSGALAPERHEEPSRTERKLTRNVPAGFPGFQCASAYCE